MNGKTFLLLATVPLLAACEGLYPPTPHPDYTIHVVSTPQGDKAIPPECPSWAAATTNPYDNQMIPQLGCATARNLAQMVERPDDLVDARPLGPERGVTAVGAVRRYDNNQTRGLIDPNTNADSAVAATTSTAPASSMSGDITGNSSAAASPSSAASSP
jgi:hypothetical protein